MCDLCGSISKPQNIFCQHSLCQNCYNLIFNTTKQCPFCNRKITSTFDYDQQVELDSLYVNPQQYQFDDVFCSVHCDVKASYFDTQSNRFCCQLCRVKSITFISVQIPTVELVKEKYNDEINQYIEQVKEEFRQCAMISVSMNNVASAQDQKDFIQDKAKSTVQTLLNLQKIFYECPFTNSLNINHKNSNSHSQLGHRLLNSKSLKKNPKLNKHQHMFISFLNNYIYANKSILNDIPPKIWEEIMSVFESTFGLQQQQKKIEEDSESYDSVKQYLKSHHIEDSDSPFKIQVTEGEFVGSHKIQMINENWCFTLYGQVQKYKSQKSLINFVSLYIDQKKNIYVKFNEYCHKIEYINGNICIDLLRKYITDKLILYESCEIDKMKIAQIIRQFKQNHNKQYIKLDTIQLISEAGLCFANKVHGSKLEQILVELYKQYQTKIIRNENNFERLTVDNWASGQFVVRNPESWTYKKQDESEYAFQSGNTKYYLGVLESVNVENKTAIVIWMNKDRNIYSVGKKNKFDLLIFNDTAIIEKVLYNVGQPNLSQSHTPGCKCSIAVLNIIFSMFHNNCGISDLQSHLDQNLLCKSQTMLFQASQCFLKVKMLLEEAKIIQFQRYKMIKEDNKKVVKYDHRSESYQIAPFMKPHLNFIKSSFTPSFAGPVVTSFDKPVVICIGQEWIFDITNKIGILHKYNSSSIDIQWKIDFEPLNLSDQHKKQVLTIVNTYNIHENTFPIHYYEHFVTPNNFQHHRLVGPTRFSKMKQLFGVLEARYEDTALVSWIGGDQTICHIGINGDLTYLGGW
ncbi:Mib_herc2_domain-containing protein [Hexamita inflata]|uniref:Mib_herc2 domain-containing protein n=1 Tax=Hexamita inflata TaxID=28002 RepID=A0AA86RIQ5_9EUKA|nr:Mib_herc2 domain-containing protein [Hexamita inflata]